MTGPVLHVVPQIIRAQVEFHTLGSLRLDVARADETSSDLLLARDADASSSRRGARKGRVLLGVLLEASSAEDVIAHIEEHACAEEEARAEALAEEFHAHDAAKAVRKKAKRAAAREAGAEGA